MKPFARKLLLMFSATVLLTSLCLSTGCGGSDPGDKARETVEELSGKNIVDKGEKLKKQINDLSDQQAREVQRNFEEGTEDQEPVSPDGN